MLVKRGAEAELRRTEFLGRAAIEKHRAPKAYRLEALDDALRGSRIRHEARLMSEARAAGVAVPILYDINLVENKIIMEFIDGPTAKDVLDRSGPAAMKVALRMRQVGILDRLRHDERGQVPRGLGEAWRCEHQAGSRGSILSGDPDGPSREGRPVRGDRP